jgi:hypothetical protein
MKLNREATLDLEDDIKAFLFIVARSVALKPDDKVIEKFTKCDFINLPTLTEADTLYACRRILRIQAEMPESRSRVSRFLNAEETRDIVTYLRQSLDSAVQLFQVCS